MKRRDFLAYLTFLGATTIFGNQKAFGSWLQKGSGGDFPNGMLVIDAHAHPDQFYNTIMNDPSSTLDQIIEVGMNASCFAAVGDFVTSGFLSFGHAMQQLSYVVDLEKQGKVRIVRKHSELPHFVHPQAFIPGVLLALEGASPLGTSQGDYKPEQVLPDLNTLYEYGVRLITLMHYLDNQFGQAMTKHQGKPGSGLTDLGQQVVERMISLGMVIDVAHAHFATLEDITDIAISHGFPVIDSHTSLSPFDLPGGGRLRTWEEMEMVAKTGGIVCTWPLRLENDWNKRLTILDWAKENYEMKKRLGKEHIGLGTDGAGVLPQRVEGYTSILDLPKLVGAMHEAGFKRNEIDDYMGKNLFRVLKQSIG